MVLPFKNPLPFENDLVKLDKTIDDKLARGELQEAERLKRKFENLKRKIYSNLSPYQRVQLSRHLDRPTSLTLIREVFRDFIELHGDRRWGDDPAIVGGLAKLGQFPVVVVAQEKGQGIKEKPKRNFGMPQPEGYRKALRLFRLGEKFGLPVVTIIDTPGAYPGDHAEERGQAQAIAECLLELAHLTVPTISVVLSEGGSGGALALGITDKIFMFEFAYYSVISPEGCASILFGDDATKYIADCASMLKLTAEDLKKFKIIDDIISEPMGGLHWEFRESFDRLKERLISSILEFSNVTVDEMLKKRMHKYYSMGVFEVVKNG
ncbi:MAG: acetyl-CoA carboxylase carboxyltransferase subunit alpha [Deltaproteobacteria bacterium]|nr:acetyl-CoA carboxylase carboxyltransferase subunit alpha [Deltaproteobacteria bacterium]MCX7953301.1 acetyl-CoA carboxylase carboxyltransferase subunit alpha [Deltaproteobacteria bacterium]